MSWYKEQTEKRRRDEIETRLERRCAEMEARFKALNERHAEVTGMHAAANAKLERVRALAFEPGALVYSDAPGYIQDIRDALDGEHTNG